MPISVGKLLIQFACSKTHIGLYPGPEAVEAFADRLKGYKTNRGTIRLPLDQEIPIALIADIAQWCWKAAKCDPRNEDAHLSLAMRPNQPNKSV